MFRSWWRVGEVASGLKSIGSEDAIELARLLQAANGLASGATPECSTNGLPLQTALFKSGRRGLTQVQLAGIVGMTAAAISRMIDQLEGERFLVRLDHPNDRRSKVIQLTSAGRERVQICDAERRQRCERAFEGITREDLARLKSMLLRVLVNLGADNDIGNFQTGVTASTRAGSPTAALTGRKPPLVGRRSP